MRGIHSVRTGILVDTGWHLSDDRSNYLGTYTFESLDAYEAGTPRSYTRRIGDPNIRYNNLQAGLYMQDDIRVNRSLTLSPGVRYEAQTHVDDVANFGPRFGVTWAPFRSGATTLRASAGIFNDWMAAGTYEQILRVDGFRQQEINIVEPSYPLPGIVGEIPPINRYLLGDDVRLTSIAAHQRRHRSAGHVSHPRQRDLRVHARRPVLARPQPERTRGRRSAGSRVCQHRGGRLRWVVATALGVDSPQHELRQPAWTGRRPGCAPMFGGPPTGPRFDLRRSSINAFYTFGGFRNNTDGPFSLPPTGISRTSGDPPAATCATASTSAFSSSALRNLSANVNLNGSTGTPYSIQTGLDDNGDLGLQRSAQRASAATPSGRRCSWR